MNKSHPSFLLIFVIAFVLRFWQIPERFVFSGEANHMLYMISDFVFGRQSPLLGLEATGYVHHLFLSPWYLYLMAPIYILGQGEPLIFAIMHSLLGLLTVIVIYKTGMSFSGKRAGLFAAFIYAVWEKTVAIDRTFMAVTLVPLAVAGVLYFFKKAESKQQDRWYIVSGIILGVSLSLHYQFLVVIILTAGWILWKHRAKFIYIFLPILISLLPLVIFDLRHHWFNLVGLYYAFQVIIKGQSPYSSVHYFYMFLPVVVLLTSYLLTRINSRVAISLLVLFAFIEIRSFFNTIPNRSYLIAEKTVASILSYYNKDLEIYFADKESYDYRYLLELRAKQKHLDYASIKIYEPWQAENSAKIRVENGLVRFHNNVKD